MANPPYGLRVWIASSASFQELCVACRLSRPFSKRTLGAASTVTGDLDSASSLAFALASVGVLVVQIAVGQVIRGVDYKILGDIDLTVDESTWVGAASLHHNATLFTSSEC